MKGVFYPQNEGQNLYWKSELNLNFNRYFWLKFANWTDQDSTLAGRRSYSSSSSVSSAALNITAVTGISVDLGRRVEKNNFLICPIKKRRNGFEEKSDLHTTFNLYGFMYLGGLLPETFIHKEKAQFHEEQLQGSAKEWSLGCVKSAPWP